MKYIHIYSDNSYCESEIFKNDTNTLAIEDEEYEQLGITKKFENGILTDMSPEEIENKKQLKQKFKF